MALPKCRNSLEQREKSDCVKHDDRRVVNCHKDWETKLGCGAAVSLTVIEVKRLILLALEMLLDSRTIRFAGALLPVVFSFVDVGIGFPVAVAAVYAVRKCKVRPCYPKTKRDLRRIALILTVCLILNVVTIVLIATNVNLKMDSLEDAFRASMTFYSSNASYKIAIDDLQLDLQCCGFNSYVDWFAFDWQGGEFVEPGDSAEYDARSVPYTCCNRQSLLPCIHVEMQKADVKTINNHGCAPIVNRILFKIAVVGYTMTSLITCTQILLIIILIRIIKNVLPDMCSSNCCSCCDSTCPFNASMNNCSSDEYTVHCCEKLECPGSRRNRKPTKTRKSERRSRIVRKVYQSDTSMRSSCASSWSSESSSSSCTRLTSSPCVVQEYSAIASISPSAHTQHRLPQRRKETM